MTGEGDSPLPASAGSRAFWLPFGGVSGRERHRKLRPSTTVTETGLEEQGVSSYRRQTCFNYTYVVSRGVRTDDKRDATAPTALA